MPAPERVFLSGWAADHPEGRLTNDDLVERMDTTVEWMHAHIGIDERRKAPADQPVAEQLAPTSARAIEAAGLAPTDIDLIVGSASYDDYMVPALGARVGALIGCQGHAFDVKAACSSWLVALDVAESFVGTGKADRALICVAEKSDLGVHPEDRNSAPFFGDATAATIVERTRPAVGLEVLDIRRSSDNAMHDAVEIPYGGWFRMDATRTRHWVEAAIAKLSHEILDHAGIGVGDLRALVCHQANLRLIERIATDLGVPPDKHWHNVAWAGNTAAAGAPTALFEGIEAHRDELVDGDLLLVVTVGAGLNVIGALLRWTTD